MCGFGLVTERAWQWVILLGQSCPCFVLINCFPSHHWLLPALPVGDLTHTFFPACLLIEAIAEICNPIHHASVEHLLTFTFLVFHVIDNFHNFSLVPGSRIYSLIGFVPLLYSHRLDPWSSAPASDPWSYQFLLWTNQTWLFYFYIPTI